MRTSIYHPKKAAALPSDGEGRGQAPPLAQSTASILPGAGQRVCLEEAHAQAQAEVGVGSKRAKVCGSGEAGESSEAAEVSMETTVCDDEGEEGDFAFSEFEVRDTAVRICKELKEENAYLITMVCQSIGNEEALKLLEETNGIEAKGGMMAQDQSKRKSPGGVFLALVKKKIGRFEFNELNRESNRERKRQKAQLKAAEPEAS